MDAWGSILHFLQSGSWLSPLWLVCLVSVLLRKHVHPTKFHWVNSRSHDKTTSWLADYQCVHFVSVVLQYAQAPSSELTLSWNESNDHIIGGPKGGATTSKLHHKHDRKNIILLTLLTFLEHRGAL